MTPDRAIEIANRLTELHRSAPWTAPIGMTAGYAYQRCARCERGRRIAMSSDVVSGKASDEDTEQFFAERFAFLSSHQSCTVHASHRESGNPILSIVRSCLIGMDLDHIEWSDSPRPGYWKCTGCDASIPPGSGVRSAMIRIARGAPPDLPYDATCVRMCREFCDAHLACATAAWRRRPN